MDWRRALRRAIENPGMAYDTAVGLLRGRYYRVKFRLLGRRVTIGKFFRVSGQLDIRGPGTVIIGDYCSIASPHLRPTTPYTHSPEAVIRIGHHVMLTGTRFGCTQLIEIGDNVSLSDSRLMVDYYRTTLDGRIVFGRGGGGIAFRACYRDLEHLGGTLAVTDDL